MEACQSYELEAVPHRTEFLLERGDRGIVEMPLPIERRRAVVGEQLAGELRTDRFGERASRAQYLQDLLLAGRGDQIEFELTGVDEVEVIGVVAAVLSNRMKLFVEIPSCHI